MHLSAFLPSRLPLRVSSCLPVYPFVRLPAFPSAALCVCLLSRQPLRPFACLPVCPFVRLPVNPSVRLPATPWAPSLVVTLHPPTGGTTSLPRRTWCSRCCPRPRVTCFPTSKISCRFSGDSSLSQYSTACGKAWHTSWTSSSLNRCLMQPRNGQCATYRVFPSPIRLTQY